MSLLFQSPYIRSKYICMYEVSSDDNDTSDLQFVLSVHLWPAALDGSRGAFMNNNNTTPFLNPAAA